MENKKTNLHSKEQEKLNLEALKEALEKQSWSNKECLNKVKQIIKTK